mgnify:CR=1 FL=1
MGRGGKKGNKSKSKKKKTYTKAQKMAQKRIAAKKESTKTSTTSNKSTPASTGRAPTKTYSKAQLAAQKRISEGKTISQVKAANKQSMKDAASERNKKFQQTRVQTLGGKKTSFTPKEQTRIKDAGYKVEGYSQAKFKPTPKPTPKVSPIDGTKVASHDKPLFKSVPARLDEPASDFYKEGMLQRNINPSTMNDLYGIGTKTAMLPGDNMGSIIGTGLVGAGALTMPSFIRGALNMREDIKRLQEKRLNPDADKVSAIGNLTGLGIGAGAPSYFSIKSPESFGAPSQEAVDKAAGITAGGLNIGGSGFIPSNPVGNRNARALFPGASPNSAVFGMTDAQLNQPGGPFNQTGPGGPEPESDYTSYQPGSYYNQSDTNMNPTNFLRSTRNVLTTPARMLGINNRFTNMLIPKSNEAIQDARDQRGPRPTLTKRRGGSGGAKLPVAPLTPEEILLPEVAAAQQTGPAYQQVEGQTGVDPNRLLQIQQEAYARAFNPYNPLTVGGFNPMFRFFGRRAGGMGRGAFRRAFRRD